MELFLIYIITYFFIKIIIFNNFFYLKISICNNKNYDKKKE